MRVVSEDGSVEDYSFEELSHWSARFAHWLAGRGVGRGDRVALMLEPSLAFYAALFGVIKRGAIAVPLFTLFGPEGLRLRVGDCRPTLLLIAPEKVEAANGLEGVEVVAADGRLMDAVASLPVDYEHRARADDLAVFQYTSGTTRALPEAVRHRQRAVVVVMIAALYGTGIRPGDRFFCPSSPAWGHGLWHGTLAPLAMGVTTGTLAGRFDPQTLVDALDTLRITNLSAAATHYRMIRRSGVAEGRDFAIRKLSFTGEPIDRTTRAYTERLFGAPVCSMYGTTEVGVILGDYPGAADHEVRAGALGKPMPGLEVEVHDGHGRAVAPGVEGEICVRRRAGWVRTRDRGWVDDDGYFFHAGRADDVIISAGWTLSAVEMEDVLLEHSAVDEVGVIAVPDELRGQVAKAFVVCRRQPGSPRLASELQSLSRERLGLHEFPRQIAFVGALPKTPAGKVNRAKLREREAGARAEQNEG